jgi:DNA-binding MarR family transcriptional regulator
MSKTVTDLVKHLGELAFATRLKRLAEWLQADVAKIYRELNVDFEPKWFTMLYALYHNGHMSVIELSNLLGLTHPAIIQFGEQMQRKKLVSFVRDKADARKKLIQLTEKGKNTFEKIEPVLREIEIANRELMQETGTNVLVTVEKMEQLLQKRNMYQRVRERLNNAFREQVKIITYNPKVKQFFKKLNEEWLKKYFTLEKSDLKILDNPTTEIIAHNGQIFFAQVGNEIIGTCAVKQTAPGTFQLLKMAVTEQYQSRGVGKLLTQEAIAYARKKKAQVLELETSRKLDKALKLYEGLGFVISDETSNKNFTRSYIKMKLYLSTVVIIATLLTSMAAWTWWMIKLRNLENGEVARLPFHHFLPGAYWIIGLIDFVLKTVN